MEFVKHYMANDGLRAALNALTRQTFGFDFEKWYAGGGWEGDYLPYSLMEGGRMLANVSANRMLFLQNGQERCYIQLGTVMTDKAYRRRGLAAQLMRTAMDDLHGECDGFYLFGDLSALGFYDKQGFSRITETRYALREEARQAALARAAQREGAGLFLPVDREDEAVAARYRQALVTAVPCSALEHVNRRSLHLFYTMSMKTVRFCEELDAFCVLACEDGQTVLQSVLCARHLPLEAVLSRINEPVAALGFAPQASDAALFDAIPWDGGEDYRLFIMGDSLREVQAQGLCFPALSHA